MKKLIPKFKNESEEFEFWSSTGPGADSTRYIDWSQAKRAKFDELARSNFQDLRLSIAKAATDTQG